MLKQSMISLTILLIAQTLYPNLNVFADSGPYKRISIGQFTQVSHQSVPFRHPVSPTHADDLSNSTVTTWVESRVREKDLFRLFYRVNELEVNPPSLQLIGIERRNRQTGELISFKHRYFVDGEVQWTHWMPKTLREKGNFVWPSESEIRNQLHVMDADGDWIKAADIAFENENKAFPLLRVDPSVAEVEATQKVSWAPGEYTWSYDSKKLKIWSGYLWDFKNGWLFKGYRKPSNPGQSLTPSQNIDSSNWNTVQSIYEKMNFDTSKVQANNSRWLSPLDKWGIWAERSFQQKWFIPSLWEATNHYKNFPWGGYCNSSVVLPFLWKKPLHSVVDKDLTFDTRDLVGLMQIASYKVDFLFWGNRYNGRTNEDISDPTPEFTIQLLQEYLGQHRTPILFDWEAGVSVGNLTALEARVKIENTSNPLIRKGTLSILNVGNMEDDLAEGTQFEEATVPDWTWGTDTKVFPFTITLNADGSLKSTQWDKPNFHPDFFWLPTGIQDYPPPHQKNPYVPLAKLRELTNKSY